MRIVFFGTPAFAVPTLEALLASRHDVTLVVTQPDRPRGRGQRTVDGPVKALARARTLPLIQPDRLRREDVHAAIASARADLGVVAAYGKILPGTLLAIPGRGMINVHASLLPRYRGAAPVHRAVMAGEPVTGVTIMRVVEALDAGPMLASVSRAIALDETSDAVERDLARLGAALLVDVVDRLAAGGVDEAPQDEAVATYAPRLTKEDGLLDWSRPAFDLHNQVRGLHPWPHAFTYHGAKRLVILRAGLPSPSTPVQPARAPAGTVLLAERDSLRIAAGTGALDILEIQSEGGRAMPVRAFLAGHRVPPGTVFGRPTA